MTFIRGILSGIFLFSILFFVNFLQMLSVVLLPFSKQAFRKFNRGCAQFWWGLCVTSSQFVNRTQLVLTGDDVPLRENVILVSNHLQMSDIPALMILGWNKKRLGDMKWFLKDVLKYVPGVGWGGIFLDLLFVKRDWFADADRIKQTFGRIIRDNIPVWVVSFSEGTRITPAKLKASQEFARQKSLPVPQHTLIPRTKGFVASVEGLRDHVAAVYDVTIGYPKKVPTLIEYLGGAVKQVHMHVKRYAIDDLPKDSEKLSEWLQIRFQEKDRMVGHFLSHGVFPQSAL